jgi:hypothetical protein
VRWRFTFAVILAGTVLGAAAPSARALTFTRHPWLNLQTETSILIAWQTDVPATGKVLYAPAPVTDWSGASETAHPGALVDHTVPLTALDPGTVYRYKVVSGADTLDAGTFRTAPSAPGPFRFLAFGDIGKATPEQMVVASRVDSLNADFAILTGDIIYDNGEPWNFTPFYFDIYRPTLKRIPFYPALGNHDCYYDACASYVSTYYLPTNYATEPEHAYSFDYGNAHFATIEVINENVSPKPAQIAWLDADLAATTKTWKFVFFHVPAYSNGGGHGGDATIAAALGPVFASRGVDIVFQGHNHFYTRTYPISGGAAVDQGQEPAYFNPLGPIYVTAGGGGRALYTLTPLSPIEVTSQYLFHTAVIDVDGDSLMLRAVGMDGTVFDTMTLKKGTTTAVEVAAFTAEPDPAGVRLQWDASGSTSSSGFNVYRATGSAAPVRLNAAPLQGNGRLQYLDTTAAPGATYRYRLGILDGGSERVTGWIEGKAGAPYKFAIDGPKPNPSGGPSAISFTLARRSEASLRIIDVQGRVVRTLPLGSLNAGPHRANWDGRDGHGKQVASGRYYVVLSAGSDEVRTPLTMLR